MWYNDTTAKTLETRMLQRLQEEMVDPNSLLYSSACPAAFGKGTAQTVTVPHPKPTPNPKAKSKGAASKPEATPKAKQKAIGPSKETSGLANTTVKRTRIKKKVNPRKGKTTKMDLSATR